MTSLRTILAPLLLGGLVLATGCQSTDYDRTFYSYDPHQSRTRAILDAQYAKGAADDATLAPGHFNGAYLNGLGRYKIDRILEGRGANGLVQVYIDLPEDDEHAADRARHVAAYLAASGVSAEMARVEMGPAPDRSSAAPGVAGMDRLSGTDRPAGGGTSSAAGSAGLLSSGR